MKDIKARLMEISERLRVAPEATFTRRCFAGASKGHVRISPSGGSKSSGSRLLYKEGNGGGVVGVGFEVAIRLQALPPPHTPVSSVALPSSTSARAEMQPGSFADWTPLQFCLSN